MTEEIVNNLIVHLKLVNGDELVGEFIGETKKNQYIIKNPMIIDEVDNPETSGIILNKYIWFDTNTEVVFQKNHVISVVPVFTELYDLYQTSLEFSNKYVYDIVMNNLAKVNNTMKQHLMKIDTKKLSKMNKTTLINHPGSESLQ